MIDTVHLFLPKEYAGGLDLPALISNRLERPTLHQNESGVSVSGHLNNLIVGANGAGLWLKGSICTYFYRNNLGNLTRQDVHHVIEQLSDVLSLPMSQANVGRIDIGKTMLTRYQPASYYPCLGICRYYHRLSQPESIRYQNSKRTLVFYDKSIQGKRAGIVLPNIWQDKNTLRYEVRFTSRLPKQFNRAEIKAADLYEENFYITLIDRWVGEFDGIQKVSNSNVNLQYSMRSLKDFAETAQRLLIEQLGGEVAVLEMIEQNRLRGGYKNRTEVKRLKDRIKDLSQLARMPIDADATTDLIQELSQKVKQVQRYYR